MINWITRLINRFLSKKQTEILDKKEEIELEKDTISEDTISDMNKEVIENIIKENNTQVKEKIIPFNIDLLFSLCTISKDDSKTHYVKDNKDLKRLFDYTIKFAKANKYIIFDDNKLDFNLNIWFIRNSMITTDAFNDLAFVFYKEVVTGLWIGKLFRVTTNPGLYYLNNPTRVEGTAIIVPGQYRSTHKIDLHKKGTPSQHEALCHRRGTILVYRDNNKDSTVDIGGEIYYNGAGLNSHRPTIYSESTGKVSKSSAGCIIHRTRSQFDDTLATLSTNTFMGLLRNSSKNWGIWNTITLVESDKLINVTVK